MVLEHFQRPTVSTTNLGNELFPLPSFHHEHLEHEEKILTKESVNSIVWIAASLIKAEVVILWPDLIHSLC